MRFKFKIIFICCR